MKGLFLLVLLLFAIETYGVYGRAQADRPTMTCELAAGPLCFLWKPNALGKVLGTNLSGELEDKLRGAKSSWDGLFESQMAKKLKDKDSIAETLGGFTEKAKQGLEKLGDSASELLQKPEVKEKAKEGLEKVEDLTKKVIEGAKEKLD